MPLSMSRPSETLSRWEGDVHCRLGVWSRDRNPGSSNLARVLLLLDSGETNMEVPKLGGTHGSW